MKRLYTLLLFISTYTLLNAQTSSGWECATDKEHEYLMQNDIAYRNGYNEMQLQINQKVSELGDMSRSTNSVNYIPIVVNVINLGEPYDSGINISDSKIIAAIQHANDLWKNAANQGGVDMGIEFCLAKIDPNGNPTNGINRVNGSGIANYAPYGTVPNSGHPGANEDSIKNLSRWNRFQYYNIWVIGSLGGTSYAGSAYMPISFNDRDGCWMTAYYMNGNNAALAHELGHAFNLEHTFEGDGSGSTCPPNNNCLTDGDKVCDTPPTKRIFCSTICDSSAVSTYDVCKNIMGYSTQLIFTAGQKQRVQASLSVSPRVELLQHNYCNSSTGISKVDMDYAITTPNPASTQLFIQTNGIEVEQINIYNTTGSLVMAVQPATSNSQLDITNLANGVYIAEIKTKDASVRKRWVKM